MYLPIEHHGLVGDMRSAALVGRDGAVSWLCLPHFDSPSVFAALLDSEKGGCFSIAPADDGIAPRQVYWPDTNVLVTRFLHERGVLQVTDYMPVGECPQPAPRLVRVAEVVRGEMEVRVACRPAFDYARAEHTAEPAEGGVIFEGSGLRLGLATHCALDVEGGAATATLHLEAGDKVCFGLYVLGEGEALPPFGADVQQPLFDQTVAYWHSWIGRCTYSGRWREDVYRSALALKLMTFSPTGAIVAAPTCSLPEVVGGERNWDYRYTWLRDAAFTIYAFLRIGFTEEAEAFMRWLEARCRECIAENGLQPVYRIDGSSALEEQVLEHLEGYRQSAPVRIGNAAAGQFQLDVYGELLDGVYLFNKHAQQISYDFWTELAELLDWVCDHWQEPDDGIWEARTAPRHYVYSKLMMWVALDRGLRLAEKRSFPAPRDRWREVRDALYLEIWDEGWSEEKQAFVQAYDSDVLDASLLIMPLVFFTAPSDRRALATLDAINRPPARGGLVVDSLVFRYLARENSDGLAGEEGAFNLCTFWLVEALTRAGHASPERLDHARVLFEKMLSYAGPLGLFAEETGPRGEALGNYPQALTHLSLISAAYNLDRALDRRGKTH